MNEILSYFYIGLQVKVQLALMYINEILFFWKYVRKITQMSKFKKIRLVGEKMFHLSGTIVGWVERHEQGNCFF